MKGLDDLTGTMVTEASVNEDGVFVLGVLGADNVERFVVVSVVSDYDEVQLLVNVSEQAMFDAPARIRLVK